MNRYHIPAVIFALCLVTALFYITLSDDAPVVGLGGDTVTPGRVKAGDMVTVSRSFRVLRDSEFTVIRTMVKGDCKVNCEIIDLSTSMMSLKAGDYGAVKRDHAIPARAAPGGWSLQFHWHWTDRIGRRHSLPLEPIKVEVLP